MKKFFASLVLFTLIPLSSLFAQWGDCSYGEEDCAYPGECSHYVDTNGDKICDHSQAQPENETVASVDVPDQNNSFVTESTEVEDDSDLISGQELKTKTVLEVAQIYQIDPSSFVAALSYEYGFDIEPTDKFQLLHDNYGVVPSKVKDIAVNIANSVGLTAIEGDKIYDLMTAQDEKEQVARNSEKKESKYQLAFLVVLTLIVYFSTLLLARIKKINPLTHKRIWNTILLTSFLISGILGILLVIRIDSGAVIPLPFNILYWHVEAGIVMVVVSFLHIFEHRKFYLNMIKKIS